MRQWVRRWSLAFFLSIMLYGASLSVSAAGEEVLKEGVLIQGMDLSGMNKEEATDAVERYIEETLRPIQVTLMTSNNTEVQVTVGDMGISWSNPELLDEALAIGTEGNVITRYKLLKDLQRQPVNYELTFDYDVNAINQILIEQCSQYDQPVINAALKRENGAFTVIEGQTGYHLDVEISIDTIYQYMTQEWNLQPCAIALNVEVSEPLGKAEELAQVTDLLGSFTTSFSSSGADRSANVTNGCRLIDGTTLYPGEEFSTYEKVSPFTQKNGYFMAGSYLNGKVVDSLGGGICQVSTTLYNAVLGAELEVTQRYNHSMIVTYVEPSADAAIAESSGKDFKFVNNLDIPIYIEGIIQGKTITFNIYGHETRSSSRKVTYESKVLEVINPPGELLYAEASQPIGYLVKGDSAHIGYKAQLWKVVTENGVEVERTQINSSSYKMVPSSYHVGVATANADAYVAIIDAINSGSVANVKNVIAIVAQQEAAAAGQ
ncbi:MAG: VanW family protein [bacterium]|nr:VanW family protein [bacterium]MCM1374384.1 VanW family protein [Muribaculum sp.]